MAGSCKARFRPLLVNTALQEPAMRAAPDLDSLTF